MEALVDISQIEKLAQDILQLPVDMTNSVQKGLMTAANKIEAKAKELAPVDRGTLKQSIVSTVKPLQAIIEPTTPYAKYSEYSRGAGGVNPAAILAWAKRKGLEQYGWAIVKTIEKHGTRNPNHPFMGPAWQQVGGTAIAEMIQTILEDAVNNFITKGKA